VSDDAAPTIRRFIGVYNAEGTLRGELAYLVGRLRRTAHCGLCDITHGRVRVRADWAACRDGLPVPFATYHLDDQPADLRPLTAGRTPAVLADTTAGPVLLLGPADLDACAASPEILVERLLAAVAARGLALGPTAGPGTGSSSPTP
jgi:hypothetical protein